VIYYSKLKEEGLKTMSDYQYTIILHPDVQAIVVNVAA
jgi:hypothetical protein